MLETPMNASILLMSAAILLHLLWRCYQALRSAPVISPQLDGAIICC